MKTKRILSITLVTALLLSLVAGVVPSVSAEPTSATAESYYIDFSEYDFKTITAESYNSYVTENNGTKPTHANVYDVRLSNGTEVGNWSLVEDATATGGKYLNYVKANTGKNGDLSSYMFVANPTGDYKTDGNHITLAEDTTYYVTIRYKVSDLTEGYNLNLFTFATSGVATPNNTSNWEDRKNVKLGIDNTNGWVVETYSFNTPKTYTGTSVHSLLMGFEPRVDGSNNRPAEDLAFTYNLSVDYISIEKPEVIPQHMQVDFNSYTPYYTDNNDCSVNQNGIWEIGTEGENKYMKWPDTKTVTNNSSAAYCFVVNPTGAGKFADRAQQYILAEGGEYRVSFKYRLPTELQTGGAVTVKVGATAGNNSAGSWSGANTAIALTPEAGTTGITLAQTTEWKTVSYTFTFTTTNSNARCVMQMAFVPNANQRTAAYSLDIDDIVVDRLSTLTIKDEAGNTVTRKGAPAAPASDLTGMGGNKAEVIELNSANAEVYNGSTANAGVIEYYDDSAKTKEISSYTFTSVNGTVYSKLSATLTDVNQVAFCGFDEYKLRTNYTADPGNSVTFTSHGYYNLDTEQVWNIVDTEAYTGKKSMHMQLTANSGNPRKFLYIGSGYELEDNTTYHLSMRIKKDAFPEDGKLTINLGYGGDFYERFIYGDAATAKKEITASDLSSDWTEITMALNYIPTVTASNYPIDYYRAPVLKFSADTNVSVYIDSVTLSKVCGEASGEVIDSNTADNKKEVRITSSYIPNSNGNITLAGTEYTVAERGVLAKAATGSSKLLLGKEGVINAKKTSNFGDYWADGEHGERIFASLLENFSVNDHREIEVRAYIKLSNGNVFYSPITTVSVESAGAPAGYTLVWGDEFDGTALDETKWKKAAYNVEAPLYQPQNTDNVMSVENGMLNLRTTRHVGASADYKYDLPFDLTTSETMNFKYGYLEVRARIPYQKGLSSGLWFRTDSKLSTDSGKRLSDTMAEIDMIETLTYTDKVTPNIHKWLNVDGVTKHSQFNSGTGNTVQSFTFENSENLCDEFHIYGFEWTETQIKMYVDRVLYATYDIAKDFENSGETVGSMAAFNDPAHILIGMKPQIADKDYDYHGDGSGFATDETTFDTPYSIDWIRLYQKGDEAEMLLK